MTVVNYFEPGLLSLFIFQLLPLIYFPFHTRFWFDIKKQKMGDFLLISISAFLTVVVTLKTISLYSGGASRHVVYFTLLHVLPLITTFLIILFKNPLNKYIVAQSAATGAGNAQDPTTKNSAIDIRPQNQEIENLTWDDLIIPQEIQIEILSVIELLRDPKTSAKYGVKIPKGIIFSGPPGNGKTTIAKVIANTAGLNFFSFSADQVISKWVGDSEKNLSNLFNAANKYKPAIVFIDEIDSIGRARSSGGEQWSENLLNHFLQLIDGVHKTEGIYVIGATNRPDLIDPALKRSGRLNKEITIPQPDLNARLHLFQLYLKKLKLADGVDVRILAKVTEGLSAADISGICNQAGINSFKRETISGKRDFLVSQQDLKSAIEQFLIADREVPR